MFYCVGAGKGRGQDPEPENDNVADCIFEDYRSFDRCVAHEGLSVEHSWQIRVNLSKKNHLSFIFFYSFVNFSFSPKWSCY